MNEWTRWAFEALEIAGICWLLVRSFGGGGIARLHSDLFALRQNLEKDTEEIRHDLRRNTAEMRKDALALTARVETLEREGTRMADFRGDVLDRLAVLDDDAKDEMKLLTEISAELKAATKALSFRLEQVAVTIDNVKRVQDGLKLVGPGPSARPASDK